MRYTREQRAAVTREYARVLHTKGVDIAAATRALYQALGHDENVRQRDMNDEQLDAVTDARQATIALMK